MLDMSMFFFFPFFVPSPFVLRPLLEGPGDWSLLRTFDARRSFAPRATEVRCGQQPTGRLSRDDTGRSTDRATEPTPARTADWRMSRKECLEAKRRKTVIQMRSFLCLDFFETTWRRVFLGEKKWKNGGTHLRYLTPHVRKPSILPANLDIEGC